MGKSFTPKNIPAGAGQSNSGGPGKMAMKVAGGKMSGTNFQGGANSYKPGNLKIANKGR